MGSRRVGDFYRAPINPYRPRLSFARDASRSSRTPPPAWSARSASATATRRRVFLDRDAVARPDRRARAAKGFVVARIAEDRPERVVAEVSSDAAGILVLTDVAYPGWNAEADGHPAEILLRATASFAGSPLPAGSHRVVFRYRPLSRSRGAAISAASRSWPCSCSRGGASLAAPEPSCDAATPTRARSCSSPPASLGLLVGSFLNVLVHRLPRGESIVSPGSHCPRCGAPVTARFTTSR